MDSTLKTENNILLLKDRCKCCLNEGDLKELWGEYWWNGSKEVYGEMLIECFALSMEQHNLMVLSQLDQICESCIVRLRDAIEFKREVLACLSLQIKCEVEETEKPSPIQYLDEHTGETRFESPCKEEEESVNNDNDIQDFQDIEYLEIDYDDKDFTPSSEKSVKISKQTNTITKVKKEVDDEDADNIHDDIDPDYSDTSEPEKPKRKWPKKRKGIHRLKIYKQYTRDDMVKALEAVQSGEMSKLQASRKYKIPHKTLASWLASAKNKDPDDEKDEKNRVFYQFVDEVKKILTYTNAVPFKTKAGRYYCAYCSTDGPFFEEPEDLRTHTRTEHVDERTKCIEIVLRPRFQNEVLKLDIHSLHCTVCCTILPTWNSMFQHLDEAHGIELDEAYTKVIPYILKRDLRCALCNQEFSHYHNLDGHMNSHYSTYICQECGDTFLSSVRLTKHCQVHVTGRYPCEACGKVFTLDKYRRKHFNHVHKQEHDIKCLYCPAKFYGMFQRHQHVVEKHKEKVKTITCELCGLTFEWKPYYISHLRRKHNIGRDRK